MNLQLESVKKSPNMMRKCLSWENKKSKRSEKRKNRKMFHLNTRKRKIKKRINSKKRLKLKKSKEWSSPRNMGMKNNK